MRTLPFFSFSFLLFSFNRVRFYIVTCEEELHSCSNYLAQGMKESQDRMGDWASMHLLTNLAPVRGETGDCPKAPRLQSR